MTSSKVGLLWRGDRRDESMSPRAEAMLGPLFSAFADLDVAAEPVVYADDAVAEVRDQLLGLDGVLVWVNPIQDGATRAHLDALLREVADRGVWVSAHPDVIARMGTKEVLFRTRDVGWGTDTDLYESMEDFTARFPARLGRDGTRVIKQARGNGGQGVWKVQLVASTDGADVADEDAPVRVQHAETRDGTTEELPLGSFMTRVGGAFAWSGCVVDQPWLPRLSEGMVRCYFVHNEVVGFCHQWPKGLLPESAPDAVPPSRPVMESPDTPAYQQLRAAAEDDWVPQMQASLGLETTSLPVIWDADFLYGPKTASGEDTYVLCEINVSAVWPYPTDASVRLAEAAVARLRDRAVPA